MITQAFRLDKINLWTLSSSLSLEIMRFLVSIVLFGFAGITQNSHAQLSFWAGISDVSPDRKSIETQGAHTAPGGFAYAAFWDWGDGTTSEGGHPQYHRYASPGTYTIKAKAWSDTG